MTQLWNLNFKVNKDSNVAKSLLLKLMENGFRILDFQGFSLNEHLRKLYFIDSLCRFQISLRSSNDSADDNFSAIIRGV